MRSTTSILTALLVSSSSAYGFMVHHARPVNHALRATSNDATSAAIAAAVAAGKEYGPTSQEARVAWDIVEEMNSSDNSAALGGSLDDECELDEDIAPISAECVEYGEKLDELQTLLNEGVPGDLLSMQKEIAEMKKNIAVDLRAVKLGVAKTKPAARSPEVTAALEAAQRATALYGKNSPESRVAWTELEEIASSGLENAMAPVLDAENCFVDETTPVEACEALEEVTRMLSE